MGRSIMIRGIITAQLFLTSAVFGTAEKAGSGKTPAAIFESISMTQDAFSEALREEGVDSSHIGHNHYPEWWIQFAAGTLLQIGSLNNEFRDLAMQMRPDRRARRDETVTEMLLDFLNDAGAGEYETGTEKNLPPLVLDFEDLRTVEEITSENAKAFVRGFFIKMIKLKEPGSDPSDRATLFEKINQYLLLHRIYGTRQGWRKPRLATIGRPGSPIMADFE